MIDVATIERLDDKARVVLFAFAFVEDHMSLLDLCQVTVRGLDPAARYAVLRSPEEKPFASLTGAELAEKGFRVEFANRQDGELFEICRQTGR